MREDCGKVADRGMDQSGDESPKEGGVGPLGVMGETVWGRWPKEPSCIGDKETNQIGYA